METVTHDGRKTAYRLVEGDASGPTTLYVHGSGGTHRLWSPQYGPNGPAHPAVAVDLSGHGESEDIDAPPGPETLAAYVSDVVAVASETAPAVLVGTSLGGAVVLQTVLERECKPQALVLAGTGAKLAVLDALREDLATDFEAAVDFLHAEERLFFDPSGRVREHSTRRMTAVGQAVTRRDFETCHRFDVRDRLDEIDVPTLAVCGEHDHLTPPAYHESLTAKVPEATMATVPKAAHLAMAERPTAFNEALAGFFDRVFVDE
ncbi:alpha/beta hydrolase [Halobacteriales archaeon QS_4_62_28]|nr:MAG: alpha/beta hydrolase [Halobacteriales archaeon QS_4_62_28]